MGGGDGGAPLWHSLVAGTCGGILGQLLSFPVDTVRVRMQTEGMLGRARQPGMWATARDIMRSEGPFALYRGLLVPCLGYGSINAVAFMTDDGLKPLIKQMRGMSSDAELGLGDSIFCGASAGVTSSLVRGPIERMKTVMQSSETTDGRRLYRGPVDTFKAIYSRRGLSGLFAGTGSTMVRESMQFAVYFPSYDLMKRGVHHLACKQEGENNARIVALATPIIGGIAGALQWLPPTYCVDVVKTRLQADVGGERYSGMWDCAVKTYQSEGAAVFFRGLPAALIRAVPLHAGVFTGVEITKSLLASGGR